MKNSNKIDISSLGLALIVLFMLTCCANNAVLSGRLIERSSRRPITYTSINLQGDYFATTDSQGYFTIPNVSDRVYVFNYFNELFVSLIDSIYIQNNHDTTAILVEMSLRKRPTIPRSFTTPWKSDTLLYQMGVSLGIQEAKAQIKSGCPVFYQLFYFGSTVSTGETDYQTGLKIEVIGSDRVSEQMIGRLEGHNWYILKHIWDSGFPECSEHFKVNQ